jgi:hypothetical protein
MEIIRLDQIRRAQLLIIKKGENSPEGVLGSEYGDSAIIFGYLKDGLFIDKRNKQYRVFKSDTAVVRFKTKFTFLNNEKPEKGEVFADVEDDTIINSTDAVSIENIGKIIDIIETSFFSNRNRLPDKDTILAKVKAL